MEGSSRNRDIRSNYIVLLNFTFKFTRTLADENWICKSERRI